MFRTRLLVLLWVCVVTAGCRPASISGESLSGGVVVEGQPLRLGLLTLVPLDSKGPKITAGIKNGQYDITSERGLWPGEYQVMITATPPDVEALIAGQGHDVVRQKAAEPYRVVARTFNTDSTLRVTIEGSAENHHDFQVHWAPIKK